MKAALHILATIPIAENTADSDERYRNPRLLSEKTSHADARASMRNTVCAAMTVLNGRSPRQRLFSAGNARYRSPPCLENASRTIDRAKGGE